MMGVKMMKIMYRYSVTFDSGNTIEFMASGVKECAMIINEYRKETGDMSDVHIKWELEG